MLDEHIAPLIQGSMHPCGIEHVVPGTNEFGQFTEINSYI
jgi:hypothetical protein